MKSIYIHRMSSEFIREALEPITTDSEYFYNNDNEGD